jgi:hypothetical protein
LSDIFKKILPISLTSSTWKFGFIKEKYITDSKISFTWESKLPRDESFWIGLIYEFLFQKSIIDIFINLHHKACIVATSLTDHIINL